MSWEDRELGRPRQSFESLLSVSPVAIVVTDAGGRVTAWNPAAERLFGYAEAEAVGCEIDQLIANREDLRVEAAAFKREAARTGRFQSITRRLRKDGSLVDVEVLAVAIEADGERSGYYAIYHDVSEVQRQRQYYESLLESSPSAIVTVTLDNVVTSWNPAAERMFGYTREEAMGRELDDLVADRPELRAGAKEINRQAALTGSGHLVTKRVRRDGSLVDVDIVGAPIVVAGEQVGLYAIYSDISELQRQKQYYASLFELSPVAVVTVDLVQSITSWNAAAERLFGYGAEEAIGRNLDDLVAYDERLHAEAVELSRAGLTGEEALYVRQRQRKDGSLVDVEIRAASIVVGGEQVGTYVIYHDISELQRQRRYYEALFELSPTAINTIDLDDRVTSWNAAAERLFGYAREEAIGCNVDDLIANTDELRAEGMELARRAESGEVHRVMRRVRKDGRLVDVDLRAAPIVVGGEVVGSFGLYHDVGELQRARREAEAATAAKSTFLATMSHEIRTPMNAVIGMTELLLGTELDAEQRGFAEVIRTSGEALLSVINDILDFSKIEAGRLDLERKPFDLRACIESAFDLVAALAAEKGLDLAYLLDPQVPEAAIGDETRLRQVLLNLLNNAVKFTESGEVVLSVDAELRPDEARHLVHFALRDTGIGIPEQRVETLFESFTQADESTTRRFGGTGLGLAISRRLAEAMGGRIWAESRAGEGSTFHFTIAVEAAPRPARRYEEGAPAPLEGRRVLILDDNATNRQILQAYVQGWGMVARETGSPAEALEWVRRGDPLDLAILDMQMPDLDGVAVAREIRRQRGRERLPLILLTSLGRREEAGGGDFAAHLTKPIRPSQLYDVLLDVLGEQGIALTVELAEESKAPAAPPVPLLILVAEDNTVNQGLALLLLKKLGHRADVASNGLEALDALARSRYDAVLMDVQMPQMDGLEATRRIHERWGADRPRIIAVTAGVLSDEREKCIAAGMDDYITKPVRLEELAAALRCVSTRHEKDADREMLDGAALQRLRETLGDESAVADLIEKFLVEAPKLVSALQNAARDGDAEKLRLAAHTLRGNAATFGAVGLAEICSQLEDLAQAGMLAGSQELVARAEAEYAQVSSVLETEHGVQFR